MARVRHRARGVPRRKSPRRRPKHLYEYLLLVTPWYNDRTRRVVTRVAVRTVKEFSTFRYRLAVDARVKGNVIHIDIRGLQAPTLTLPEVGPAVFETEFDNLAGNYDVVVRKLRKDENLFRIKISPERVTIEDKPPRRFVDVITHAEQW